MKKTIFTAFIFIFLYTYETLAQSSNKQAIKASIGYGISTPYDDVEVTGKGFYAQGEYVYELYTWLDFRPYAGAIFSSSDEKDNSPNEAGFKSDTNAFLIGGKTRLTAPIPWVAPYVEIGIGLSVGEFNTITATTNIKESGLLYHIPFSLGLELGRKHNFDVAFTYYFHNGADQFAGAAAFGITFPLN